MNRRGFFALLGALPFVQKALSRSPKAKVCPVEPVPPIAGAMWVNHYPHAISPPQYIDHWPCRLTDEQIDELRRGARSAIGNLKNC